MIDANDESQKIAPVKEVVTIPSDAEHKRFIRRLWKTCMAAALVIFVTIGGIVLALFLKGYDSKKIVEVSTSVFQVLVLSYGMGFFVPAFLTSLINMALGVKMSRRGMDIGQETASVIEKVDKAIESRLSRIDALVTQLEEFAKKAEAGELPAALKKWADESKAFVEEELRKLGWEAETSLRAALRGKLSLDARAAAERIVAHIERQPSDRIRRLRLVEVLEHLGTPEARRFLDGLAHFSLEASAARTRLRQTDGSR